MAPFSLTQNGETLKFDRAFKPNARFLIVHFDEHRLFGFGERWLLGEWILGLKQLFVYDTVSGIARTHLIPGLDKYMPKVGVI